MVDGILGGIGDFFGGAKDFLLGGGRYADPTAINPQYGVPEADVRQAGINTLANVSALLLAAGQPMSGAQRAQMLAGIGPAFGGMSADIQKSLQARKAAELFPLQKKQLQQTISKQELEEAVLRQQLAQQQAEREQRAAIIRQMFPGQEPAAPSGGAIPSTVPVLARPIVPTIARPPGAPPIPVPTAPVAPMAMPATSTPTGTPAAPSPAAPAEQSLISELPPEYLRSMLADPSMKFTDIYKRALEERSTREKEAFERSAKLRGEFDKTAVPFRDRQTAYMTMIDLAQNKQGASDMALVLSIMKVYDPTSTVTGGEAATAQNAAGVPEFVRGYYNKLIGEGALSDKARSDLVRAAETRFEQEMDSYEKDIQKYTALSKSQKVNVGDVVTDVRDPTLKEARQSKKDFDLAARRITPEEISQLPPDILIKLNPRLMGKQAAEAYKSRVDEVTRLQGGPQARPSAPSPYAVTPEMFGGMYR